MKRPSALDRWIDRNPPRAFAIGGVFWGSLAWYGFNGSLPLWLGMLLGVYASIVALVCQMCAVVTLVQKLRDGAA